MQDRLLATRGGNGPSSRGSPSPPARRLVSGGGARPGPDDGPRWDPAPRRGSGRGRRSCVPTGLAEPDCGRLLARSSAPGPGGGQQGPDRQALRGRSRHFHPGHSAAALGGLQLRAAAPLPPLTCESCCWHFSPFFPFASFANFVDEARAGSTCAPRTPRRCCLPGWRTPRGSPAPSQVPSDGGRRRARRACAPAHLRVPLHPGTSSPGGCAQRAMDALGTEAALLLREGWSTRWPAASVSGGGHPLAPPISPGPNPKLGCPSLVELDALAVLGRWAGALSRLPSLPGSRHGAQGLLPHLLRLC